MFHFMWCPLWNIVFCATLKSMSAANNIETKTSTIGQGSVYYVQWDFVQKSQTWTFLPPNNRTDVVFFLKLQHYRKIPCNHRGCYSLRSITLPNGIRTSRIPSRLYWSSEAPWCGNYVKAPLQFESTCLRTFAPNKTCNSSTKITAGWQPKITTHFWRYAMILEYGFVECPAKYKHNPSAMPTVTDYPAASLQRRVDSSIYAAAILAVLFLMTLIVLAALLYKYRILSLQSCTKTPANQNPANQQSSNNPFNIAGIAAGQDSSLVNLHNPCIDNRKDDAANGTYVAATDIAGYQDGKVVINNVLYGISEKKTVDNELYKM